MFSNIAYAGAETSSQPSAIMQFLPIVVIFAIFYFLIIRPQSKKAKAENQMREALQIGNKVVTTAGIFGQVVEIHKEKSLISVSIAKDVTVVMYKSSIANVLKENEPETKEKK